MSTTDFDRRLNDWFDAVEPRQVPPALVPQVLRAVRETHQQRGIWHRIITAAVAAELAWPSRSRAANALVLAIITALLIVALAAMGFAAGLIRLPSATMVDGLIAVQADMGTAEPYTYQIQFFDPTTGVQVFATPSDVRACGAHFSPDGSRYAFLEDNAADEISVAVAPTTADYQPTLLFHKPAQAQFDPSWAPDGSAMVATMEVADGGYRELWVLPANGSPGKRLTAVQASYSADWSASGEWIAFVGVGLDHPLYLIRRDGSDLRLVRPQGVESVAWSPVADVLAYSGSDAKLHVISLDGSESLAVYDGRALPVELPVAAFPAPVWSDDGTQLAVVRDGVLRIVDVEAGTVETTSLAAPITSAVWSATGRSLAVVAAETDAYSGSLWVVSLDGVQPRLIAEGVRASCMSAGAALSWQRVSK